MLECLFFSTHKFKVCAVYIHQIGRSETPFCLVEGLKLENTVSQYRAAKIYPIVASLSHCLGFLFKEWTFFWGNAPHVVGQ